MHASGEGVYVVPVMNKYSSTDSPISPPINSEAISRRAYELWEREGRPDNCDLRHWLQAEAELGIGRSDGPDNGVRPESSAPIPIQTGSDVRPLEGTRAAAAANRDNKRGGKNTFASEKSANGDVASQSAARRKPSNAPVM